MTSSVYNITRIGFCPLNNAFSVRYLYNVAPLLGVASNQNPITERLITRRNAFDLIEAIRTCNNLMELVAHRIENRHNKVELDAIITKINALIDENDVLICDFLLTNTCHDMGCE